MIIASGTTLTTMQNMNVANGGNLTISGTLNLKKDMVNQNPLADDLGTGIAVFTGTALQTISGENIFQHLQVSNGNGLSIGGNTRINGIFILTYGQVALGSYKLVLGPLSAINGTPSASTMIVATGTGELRKEFTAPGSFTFPVGDATGTSEYSPVTLNFTSGTFGPGNYAAVSLANTVYPDPTITGNYLKRYWNLSQSGISGFSCDAAFTYLPADVTGNENAISCTRVNPLPWTTYSLANTATHVLNANGITGFSSFTGLKSSTTPTNQNLANISIGNGVTNCYDASQVLTVAGNGTTFTVAAGGSVTLVAGLKISMLPGTTVNSGGYLHGYIATGGIYCGSALNPLVSSLTKEIEIQPFAAMDKGRFIKIYPNPTTDIVNVEFLQKDPGMVNISIFNMNGQQIATRTAGSDQLQQFSLGGLPAGIYMIHAGSAGHSEVAKIVKE
jgi:hypothetical protein